MHRRVRQDDLTAKALAVGSQVDCFHFEASAFLDKYATRQKHAGQPALCAEFRVSAHKLNNLRSR